jgi:hypothetical protein
MVRLLDPVQMRSERWELRATNPAPHTLLSRVSGQVDLEAVRHLMRAFDQVAASQGVVDAFHDWELVDGYTSEAREAYVRWSSGHPEKVSSVHILVRSRMVSMAISVGNLVVGGFLQPYSDRKAFDQMLLGTIVRRKRAAA